MKNTFVLIFYTNFSFLGSLQTVNHLFPCLNIFNVSICRKLFVKAVKIMLRSKQLFEKFEEGKSIAGVSVDWDGIFKYNMWYSIKYFTLNSSMPFHHLQNNTSFPWKTPMWISHVFLAKFKTIDLVSHLSTQTLHRTNTSTSSKKYPTRRHSIINNVLIQNYFSVNSVRNLCYNLKDITKCCS